MIGITVVGAGDVFLNRYLAASVAIGEEYDFALSDVVDIRPPPEIMAEIGRNPLRATIKAHQLLDVTSQGLIDLLDLKGLMGRPVIIATPTKYHVPYASALLKRGMTVCIEKPLAAKKSHVLEFDRLVRKLGTDRLFLLGYYALEKGLPALVLARCGDPHHQGYLDFLLPPVEPMLIAQTRKSLGRVRQVRAVLLEGQGPAGRLDHRSWVLEHSSGGNTVDTFYHLVCMVLPFLGDSTEIQVANAALAQHHATARRFCELSGREAAETLTVAQLSTKSGAEAWLACAKNVPESLHQRWMEVEFDHGWAFVDFEDCTLKVKGQDLDLLIELRYKTKYATQLALFAQKIRVPQMRTEYQLFRDALLLTLDIRQLGLERGSCYYDSEDLTLSRIEEMLD